MDYDYDDEGSFPFTFCWKIENFSMAMPYRKKWLYSPLITIPLTNISWKIMVHPNFESNRYVSVYLRLISIPQKRENRDYTISLSVLGMNDWVRKYVSRSGNIEKLNCWGSKEFIAWNLLIKEKEIWLPDDTLTIECVIEQCIHDNDSFNSFLTSMYKLYDKENRYPSEYVKRKHHANALNQPQDTKTVERTETLNSSFQFVMNKHHRIPVLHSWFQDLYSKASDSESFCSLESVIENGILKNMNAWPDIMPTKWVSRFCLRKDVVSFTWYIKQFSHLTLSDKFFSPAFHCGSSDWKLMFFLSRDPHESEVAEIFVCPMSLYLNRKMIIKCKISVVNRAGRLPLSREMVHLYDNNGQWKFPTFIRSEILDVDKSVYLTNDVLCLYCTFSVSEGNYECKRSWTAVEYSNAFRTQYIPLCGTLQFREDIMTLFETGRYSDVLLKVGQSTIPAHQSILSLRSLEFRCRIKSLNKTDSKEKMVIEIKDLEEETLKTLLKYIYSGKYDFYWRDDRNRDFMYAAHKYGVDVELMETYLESCELFKDFQLLQPLILQNEQILPEYDEQNC